MLSVAWPFVCTARWAESTCRAFLVGAGSDGMASGVAVAAVWAASGTADGG